MVTELLEPLEKLTIVEATWNDFDAILRVLNAVDHEFVPPLSEGENLRVKVSRILNDRRRSWIKAVDGGGKIVGVVAVIDNYRRPRLGLIETLAVLPEFRRRGIGKKLVQYAMSKLFQNGMEASLITTWETNVAALTMYEELGFKMIMRKKVDSSYFKLFFTRSFEQPAPSSSGLSRFWRRR
ncbi:MAG TPA: GNAT family N-acetyltransferase [Candidatus Bathyarchaeia archaeon]|nr:GNAT family N-acetyltransferase [Candidatus Bathyarchaeia archaeon]